MTAPNTRMASLWRELVVCAVFFSAAGFAQDPSFLPPRSYPVGIEPDFVAVGDFDGDGRLDLVVANAGSRGVSVLLGNGDGTFQAARNFRTGNYPASVAVGDFNGDGRQDLAVANFFWKDISVLLGNGDGTFQAARNFPAGGTPLSIAVGDFNGDGRPDLAVAKRALHPVYQDAVAVFLGNGDGTFQDAREFGGVKQPRYLAVGDFNGDGVQDLAVPDFVLTSQNVSVLLGNGDGTFQSARNFAAGHSPLSVAVGDFNGDGWQDLAVANAYSANLSVLLGNGDGTFQSASFSVGFQPVFIAVGDFNGDGRQDLAVANISYHNVAVFTGNGDGSFQAPLFFSAASYPDCVAVGDFNGDGRPDLVVTNSLFNHVSVLINDTPWPDNTVGRQ